MLLFLIALICCSFGEITSLNETTIYLEIFGKIEYLPNKCKYYCPNNSCIQCNITNELCDTGSYLKVKNVTEENFMVGIYTKIPSKACVKDTVLFTKPGLYIATINKFNNFLQFIVTTGTTNDFVNSNIIIIDFILGYQIN